MTTWSQIIALCLRDAGVAGMGQTPNGQMMADAVARANFMIDEWREDEFVIYRLDDLSFVMTGAQSYTVGPGANFNIAVRPELIDAAYLRQTSLGGQNVDYPLEVLNSRVDYSRIALKSLTGAPSDLIWYDNAYPVGTVYPWPVPGSTVTYELHLLIRALLDRIDDITATILLPPRYSNVIYWNLCMNFREAFGLPARPLTVKRAGATLRSIRRKNAHIPTLGMPAGLGTIRAYNPISDR
jgi:hypothetical protein